jgi:hypothetical protein
MLLVLGASVPIEFVKKEARVLLTDGPSRITGIQLRHTALIYGKWRGIPKLLFINEGNSWHTKAMQARIKRVAHRIIGLRGEGIHHRGADGGEAKASCMEDAESRGWR